VLLSEILKFAKIFKSRNLVCRLAALIVEVTRRHRQTVSRAELLFFGWSTWPAGFI